MRGIGTAVLVVLLGLDLRGAAALEHGQCDHSTHEDCEFERQDLEVAENSAFVLLQTGLQRSGRPPSLSGIASRLPDPDDKASPSHPHLASPVVGSPERPHGTSQTFVQLFEWSWSDVAKECETFLGPKGFNAALISPPNEHIVGDSWFTRYQPVSYQLVSRSGNETEFVDMIRRCRAVGVGIYADAVFNHCAAMGGVGIGGSMFGNRSYPMFGPADFHHVLGDEAQNCGVDNYDDKHNVQYCDLQGMPDLCTSCPHAQDVIAGYLNRMARLGIAGFRVDAAKHMDAGELRQLLSKVNSSLFIFQEVLASYGEAVQAPGYYANGPVLEFGFAATLAPKFTGTDLLRDDLAKFGEPWGLAPTNSAIVFLDDHDSQRSGAAPLTFKSGSLYDVVSVFMLAYPYGYPKVMSSFNFTSTNEGPPKVSVHNGAGGVRCGSGQPWVCEHRRPAIANMVTFRAVAGDAAIRNWAANGDTLSFCRGTAACVAFNIGDEPWDIRLSVTMPAGDYCNVILSAAAAACPSIRVNDEGIAALRVPAKGAVAFHVGAPGKPAEDDLQAAA